MTGKLVSRVRFALAASILMAGLMANAQAASYQLYAERLGGKQMPAGAARGQQNQRRDVVHGGTFYRQCDVIASHHSPRRTRHSEACPGIEPGTREIRLRAQRVPGMTDEDYA